MQNPAPNPGVGKLSSLSVWKNVLSPLALFAFSLVRPHESDTWQEHLTWKTSAYASRASTPRMEQR
jgi:hypothetical protein